MGEKGSGKAQRESRKRSIFLATHIIIELQKNACHTHKYTHWINMYKKASFPGKFHDFKQTQNQVANKLDADRERRRKRLRALETKRKSTQKQRRQGKHFWDGGITLILEIQKKKAWWEIMKFSTVETVSISVGEHIQQYLHHERD